MSTACPPSARLDRTGHRRFGTDGRRHASSGCTHASCLLLGSAHTPPHTSPQKANQACKWLTDKSGGTDPTNWKGGDFLPTAYTQAATCACTGGGNPLWSSEVATCVRGKVIEGFKQMQPADKLAAKANPDHFDPAKWDGVPPAILQAVYTIQTAAYSSCGCPGTQAPFATWVDTYYKGNYGGAFGSFVVSSWRSVHAL